MNALEHFESLYGDLHLSPEDAAKWVFLSGWNSAMSEAMKRVNAMPFGNDTRASFAVYFQQMMVVDPSDTQEHEPENEPHVSLASVQEPVEFEDWHSANYVQPLEKYGDSYKNMHVRNRWQGWLGAKSTTQPAQPAPVQPVAAPKDYTMGDWFNDLENPHGNR
jgi:hypothetical protein